MTLSIFLIYLENELLTGVVDRPVSIRLVTVVRFLEREVDLDDATVVGLYVDGRKAAIDSLLYML
jgi:hypothetical protein